MKEHLVGLEVREYDPAIFGKDDPPEPADMVYCGDVLEHVEPECVDAVLDDLARVTGKIGLVQLSTQPALKILPDGRNTHLTIHPAEWWMTKLRQRFRLAEFHGTEGDAYFILIGKAFAQSLVDEAISAKDSNGSGESREGPK